MNGHGGVRRGAGKKKGVKHASTLSKEAARELFRQIVTRKMEGLIAAQLDNAQGIRHLMKRDPATGKFERVMARDNKQLEEAEIDATLKSGGFWIYTKDPSVQAFTDLMNRALDKPAEQITLQGNDEKPIRIEWLSPTKK